MAKQVSLCRKNKMADSGSEKKEWYSLCNEDIEQVAGHKGITLSEDETNQVATVASEMIEWYDTISSAIDIVLKRR